MNKFNLKYLVIAAVILSLLMVGGALIFSKIGFKTQKLPTQSPQVKSPIPLPSANVAPTTGSSGGAGQQPGKAEKAIQPEPIK